MILTPILAQISNQPPEIPPINPVVAIVAGVIGFAFVILMIASIWRVFTKAGEPGCACLIPFHNTVVLLKLAGKPCWWFFLMLIPLVGIVIFFIVNIQLAERFGKTAGFGIGLSLLGFIFLPILAFGDAQYLGDHPSNR
ncbi:MAG: DUF5684 domain-containing protein [Verrucomicrobia bacterium]|nr:DUF5684 domain-containing protein [Verrucomicrobiota bacterium]